MRLKTVVMMGLGALRANLTGRRIPLNVMLSVTNRCPGACRYCAIRSRPAGELSTAEIFSLIDQIAGQGCQRLGLWGGEPLVRDDIGAIIDYAKAKGLFVTLDSNGYLVPGKMEAIRNADHLVLSLDGPREMHDANRGAGSFDQVLKALDAARGRLPVWTITVLTKHNLPGIDDVLSIAEQYGARATFQVLHHNTLLGRDHESLMPSNEEYRAAIRALLQRKREGAPIVSSFAYLEKLLAWPDYRKSTAAYGTNRSPCWAGKLYCNVDTDGSLYPCSLLIGAVSAHNFRTAGFRQAFDALQGNVPCGACTASCFNEYNSLFSFDRRTIREWMTSFFKTSAAGKT